MLRLATLALGVIPPIATLDDTDLSRSAVAWARHTIDASSRGADGVRLADLDGDGLPDIATGWEEGGLVRVALNPGPGRSRNPWPAVTVGRVSSPEDAVIIDLDGDGAPDLLSCCEGNSRSVFVHWGPANPAERLDPDRWATAPIPATVGAQMWMWCLPLQVDGRFGVDLVLGGKGPGAAIGWLEAPEQPRGLDSWRWHPIRSAGWVMSILPIDLDGDGDPDLLCSDRKGPRRGIFWLECREGGSGGGPGWVEHAIGGDDAEVMFLNAADLDGDARPEVIAAARDLGVLIFHGSGDGWGVDRIPLGAGIGTGKAVAVGDLDGDGRAELVVSTENAHGKHGVVRLSRADDGPGAPWSWSPLSGPGDGSKFDLVRLIDLDGDGDLDVLTCEELDGLGVIWYENPAAR